IHYLDRLLRMILQLLTVLYVVCALLLTLYAGSEVILLLIYWRYHKLHISTPHVTEWPSVLVQLPIYNEYHVVERLLDAMDALDYPRDKLIVQVLDDSNDDTVQVAAARIAALRETGLNIHHVRRENRVGYKAGALAYGMSLVDCELVVVL